MGCSWLDGSEECEGTMGMCKAVNASHDCKMHVELRRGRMRILTMSIRGKRVSSSQIFFFFFSSRNGECLGVHVGGKAYTAESRIAPRPLFAERIDELIPEGRSGPSQSGREAADADVPLRKCRMDEGHADAALTTTIGGTTALHSPTQGWSVLDLHIAVWLGPSPAAAGRSCGPLSSSAQSQRASRDRATA